MPHKVHITMEHCSRLVGRRVIVHHRNGQIYDATLHSVGNNGIYLVNATLVCPASASTQKTQLGHAIANAGENSDITDAFFPFLFLPLVALAGLAAARPYPYGYPYGYGYPYRPW